MLNPSTLGGPGVVRARSRSRSRTRIGYPNTQERHCMCLINIKETYFQFCHHLSLVICYLTNDSWHRTWPIMNNSLLACKIKQNITDNILKLDLLSLTDVCVIGRGGWPCNDWGVCRVGEEDRWSWDSQSRPHPPAEERPAGQKKKKYILDDIWLI